MAITKQHNLHQRRFGRNVGLGLVLVGLVGLVFGLTVVKVTNGGLLEAYDHQSRTTLLPATEPVE